MADNALKSWLAENRLSQIEDSLVEQSITSLDGIKFNLANMDVLKEVVANMKFKSNFTARKFTKAVKLFNNISNDSEQITASRPSQPKPDNQSHDEVKKESHTKHTTKQDDVKREEDGEVMLWLQTLKLPQYYSLFIDEGIDEFEDLYNLKDEEDLQQYLEGMGIHKKGHRRRIVKAIKAINEKLPELDEMKLWLDNLNLSLYYSLFIAKEYGDLSSLNESVQDAELIKLGITNRNHRRIILKAIEEKETVKKEEQRKKAKEERRQEEQREKEAQRRKEEEQRKHEAEQKRLALEARLKRLELDEEQKQTKKEHRRVRKSSFSVTLMTSGANVYGPVICKHITQEFERMYEHNQFKNLYNVCRIVRDTINNKTNKAMIWMKLFADHDLDTDELVFKPRGVHYTDSSTKCNPLIICIGIDYYQTAALPNLMETAKVIETYKSVFEKLYNYKIIANDPSKPINANELVRFLRNAMSKHLYDFAQGKVNHDSFIVTFYGHGTHDSVICSDGTRMPHKELSQIFKLKELSQIPRIFLFDSCQGFSMAPRAR
eukprot:616560_1